MIDKPSHYDVSAIFADLRHMALNASPAEIGIQCAEDGVAVWGILMETGYPKAVATLVTLADGTVSLYFSNGGGIIGVGQNAEPRSASEALLQSAPKFLNFMQLTADFPLPLPLHSRFYLLTNNGIFTAEATDEDLRNGKNSLSSLFYKAHELISTIRAADQQRRAQQSIHEVDR